MCANVTGALYPTPDTSGEGMDENCGTDQLISNFEDKRHLLFTQQFPVSPDSANDVNQRCVSRFSIMEKKLIVSHFMLSSFSLMHDLSAS